MYPWLVVCDPDGQDHQGDNAEHDAGCNDRECTAALDLVACETMDEEAGGDFA